MGDLPYLVSVRGVEERGVNQKELDIINDNTMQLIASLNALKVAASLTVDIHKGRCRLVKLGKTVIMEDGEQRLMLIPAQSYNKGGSNATPA